MAEPVGDLVVDLSLDTTDANWSPWAQLYTSAHPPAEFYPVVHQSRGHQIPFRLVMP